MSLRKFRNIRVIVGRGPDDEEFYAYSESEYSACLKSWPRRMATPPLPTIPDTPKIPNIPTVSLLQRELVGAVELALHPTSSRSCFSIMALVTYIRRF